MTQIKYPARYVVAATDPQRQGVVVYADEAILHNDAEARLVLMALQRGDAVIGVRYSYTLVCLDDVDRVIAQRKAELENYDPLAALAEAERKYQEALRELNGKAEDSESGEVAPSPDSEPSGNEELSNGHFTISGGNGQVGLHQASAILPVWGTAQQTMIRLLNGQNATVDTPHHVVENTVKAMGWVEPVDGSGYWMRP